MKVEKYHAGVDEKSVLLCVFASIAFSKHLAFFFYSYIYNDFHVNHVCLFTQKNSVTHQMEQKHQFLVIIIIGIKASN